MLKLRAEELLVNGTRFMLELFLLSSGYLCCAKPVDNISQ